MTVISYAAIKNVHADHVQSELVINGTFDTTTTGWTAGDSAVLSIDAARLKITNGAADNGYAYQAITTVIGFEYFCTFDFEAGTTAAGQAYAGTSAGIGDLANLGFSGTSSYSLTFTATTTTTYLSFYTNVATISLYTYYDNISCALSGSIDLDVEATVMNQSFVEKTNESLSLDGTQETIFHREDKIWSYTSNFVTRENLTDEYWYEFLASINAGETFTLDPYGTVASPDNPINVKLVKGSRSIVREGLNNLLKVSFSAREV